MKSQRVRLEVLSSLVPGPEWGKVGRSMKDDDLSRFRDKDDAKSRLQTEVDKAVAFVFLLIWLFAVLEILLYHQLRKIFVFVSIQNKVCPW